MPRPRPQLPSEDVVDYKHLHEEVVVHSNSITVKSDVLIMVPIYRSSNYAGSQAESIAGNHSAAIARSTRVVRLSQASAAISMTRIFLCILEVNIAAAHKLTNI